MTNLKCIFCPKEFCIQNQLIKHLYTECLQPELLCNIYNFNTNLFANKIYQTETSGEIYIIQKDNIFSNYYKIGMTTDLESRYAQYKCGSVIDPIIHYYYPFRNIKEIDRLLKTAIKNFKFKKEIYKCDDLKEIRDIIRKIQLQQDDQIIELTPKINPELRKIKKNILEIEDNKEIILDKFIEPSLGKKLIESENNISNNNVSEEIKNKCKICNKLYSSYKSLWTHNNKFHFHVDIKIIKCKYCSKIFNHKQSKSRHQKTCNYQNK
jgi:hypothetical protein